jgi:hypothetical protein
LKCKGLPDSGKTVESGNIGGGFGNYSVEIRAPLEINAA